MLANIQKNHLAECFFEYVKSMLEQFQEKKRL